MTKKETTMLLEAVKNAPIIDGVISVKIGNTTFSFGDKYCNAITEQNRGRLLNNIEMNCRAKLTETPSKRKLDSRSRVLQDALLWWKENIAKTDAVLYAYKLAKDFNERWRGKYSWNQSEEEEKLKEQEYEKVMNARKATGITEYQTLFNIASMRSSVPTAWINA